MLGAQRCAKTSIWTKKLKKNIYVGENTISNSKGHTN